MGKSSLKVIYPEVNEILAPGQYTDGGAIHYFIVASGQKQGAATLYATLVDPFTNTSYRSEILKGGKDWIIIFRDIAVPTTPRIMKYTLLVELASERGIAHRPAKVNFYITPP